MPSMAIVQVVLKIFEDAATAVAASAAADTIGDGGVGVMMMI